MVKALKLLILVIGVVAVATLLWQRFGYNEPASVKKMLHAVAKTVSIPQGETTIQAGLAVSRLLEFLTKDVQVDVEGPGSGKYSFHGREEIREALMYARKNMGPLDVRFLDIAVTVAPDRQTAEAQLTVQASRPGEREPWVQAVRVQLQKVERNWRIQRAETIRPLTL